MHPTARSLIRRTPAPLLIAAFAALLALSSFTQQATLLSPRVALAATNITITTTDDELNSDGDCSLREAIEAANTDTAVDACAAGSGADTITLPAGTYTLTLAGAGENANATGDLDITSDLTIAGAGAGITIIDGNAADRTLQSSAPMTVTDLTIRNGNPANNPGGGILASNSLVLTNVEVLGNIATSGGGLFNTGATTIIGGTFNNNSVPYLGSNGGALLSSGTLTITNTNFIGNTVGGGCAGGCVHGGGAISTSGVTSITGGIFQNNQCTQVVCVAGAIKNSTTTTISGTHFIDNTSQGEGGALRIIGGATTLTNARFVNNRSNTSVGGAISVTAGAVSLTINDSQFINNFAANNGGAIRSFKPVNINRGLFEGNVSTVGGGAILISSAAATINGTIFKNNRAATLGGAVVQGASGGTITNALFINNGAGTGGEAVAYNNNGGATLQNSTIISSTLAAHSAIYNNASNATVQNTIITSHTVALQVVSGQIAEDYNLFFNNNTNFSGSVVSGGHSIGGDPRFADPASDNYHLRPGSPAIDVGTNVGVTSDFDGEPRPLGCGFDIGYDETTELPPCNLSASNDSPTARGSATNFTATANGNNIVYAWNFGDGQIGSGATTSHAYAAGGSYTAIVTATNGLGSASATTAVQVLAPPTLGTYPVSAVPLSRNATVAPSAAPANAQRIVAVAPPEFKGAVAVDPTTGVIRLTNAHPAGTYPVTVTAFASNGTSATETLDLSVDTPPVCNYGTFNPATTLTALPTNPIGAAVGDFNNDGKQDLAVASWAASRLSIYLGDGAGGFGAPTTLVSGARPWGVVVRDINGDGRQDLVTPNSGGGNVSIYLGNGAGGFSAPTSFGAGTAPYAVVVSDFNNDAKFDLAVGNLNSSNISVLLGDGTGSFGAATTISLGTRPHNINVGDFNGDGNPDLVSANWDAATTSVLLGNGVGGFGAPTSFAAGANPSFVGIGDFNEDGRQDLAVSNYGAGTLSVLLGNGDGTFAPKTDFPAVSAPFGTTVGDFNRDGHLDLATASQGSARVSVLLGNGAGSFGAATNFITGNGGYPPAVGDFNADGKQDLAVPNFNSNTVSLLPGQCGPTISDIIDQSTNEDVFTGAIGFIVGDPETAAGSLTVTGSSSNTTLVPNGNIVFGGSGANRTVTITPAANQSGSTTITVQVSDGIISTSDTFVLTVNPVNDVPSFTKGANQTVLEDASAQSVATWATAISAGPADESAQTVSFLVTNNNNALFTVQPAIAADGTLTYTSAANANGSATVTVRAQDTGGTANGGVDTSAPQTFIITVTPVNDAPSFTKGADQSVAEDASAQSVATWATAISAGPANESAQTVSFLVTNDNSALFSAQPAIAANGTLTYTPAANATGSATVTVQAQDSGGTANGGVNTSAPQTFIITVTSVNDAPVASAGSLTTNEDSAASSALNATDVDGDSLTYSIVANGAKGVATITNAATGAYTYTPNPNANGADSFTFKANDGTADSNVATVSVMITEVNDAPSGTDDSLGDLVEDSGGQVISFAALLANDTAGPANESGQSLAIVSAGSAVGGTVGIVGTDVIFTPAADYNGPGAFSYTVEDNGTTNGIADPKTATANATFMITAVNDAPSFTKGADQSVAEDLGAQSVSGWATGISAGPANESGQTISFLVTNDNTALFAAQPAVAADGTLSYSPAANANGSATVTVQAQDDGGTASGGIDTAAAQTFTITITPVNDAPIASDGSLITNEDTPASGTLVATDVDGNPLLYSIVTNGTNGVATITDAATGAYTYTPNANANGADSVTFKTNDGTLDSNIATVSITITPVNDAPITSDGSLTTNEDTPASGTLVAADVDGDALTYSIVANGTKGVATITDAATGAYTYTPNANANGADSVTFQVNDGTLDSNVATISITITPANDAPIASDGSLTTAEDTPAGGTLVATDVDGDALVYSIVTNGTKGVATITDAATGAYTYTPNANANGADSVTFQVNDGTIDSNVATISVTITPVNDAPVASAGSLTTNEDIAASSTLVATDVDGNPLTYSIVTNGSKGVATITNAATGAYTYTPNANANGADSVTFQVNDGTIDSNVATISVTITPVNDVPVASDGSLTTNEDTATSGTLSASDTDGDSLTYSLVANGTLGSARVNADGSYTYTPNPNANGADSFTFKANDGTADSNIATVSVTITAVDDAPTLDLIADVSLLENAPQQTVSLSGIGAGPADENGQTLTVTATSSNPALIANPTVTYTSPNATGTLSFTPAAGLSGSATITVTVTDSGSGIAPNANTFTRTFVVFVGVVNNRPAIDQPADVTILEDSAAQTVNLTGIDVGSSAETGQSLTVTAVSSTPALIANPIVTYNSPDATGTLSYQPVANASGTATITVTVRDDGGTLNGGIDVVERVFSISVTPVNDAPDFTTGANQTVTATAGPQTLAGWATGFTPGPADESSQTLLGYTIVSNSNPALFDAVPTLAADGTLTYTPKLGVGGTATISVTVRDSGGTANGGVDTSAIKTFTISVGSSYRLYLPLMGRLGAPDLVVTSIGLSPNKASFSAGEPVEITVVVENRGDQTAGSFWVDLSINPDQPPTTANQPWNEHCTLKPCLGLAWYVQELAPGASITLTSKQLPVGYSIWPGWLAAGTTDLYAYVDTYNDGVARGAVAERDESNNQFHLGGLTVTGSNPPLVGLRSVADLRQRPVRFR